MLLNNFYTLESCTHEERQIRASLQVNPAHEIFKGHFPGQPVVPGVCMIQIIKELLQQNRQQNLIFSQGHQLKFLQLWVPEAACLVDIQITWEEQEEGAYLVNAFFEKTGTTLFKLKGTFHPY